MDPCPSPRVIYTRRCNFGLFGLDRLHPFDARKYAHVWAEVVRQLGRPVNRCRVAPRRPIGRADLLRVHSADYLDSLRRAATVAKLVEVDLMRRLPGWATDRMLLRPMRWATAGTVLAAELAVDHGLAVNLGGGYHHARPDHGHGFSAYADVAVAVAHLRHTGRLAADARVAYVDLDAHQGDGVCYAFRTDRRVLIYDQYNRTIFPHDPDARRRVDCDVPLSYGCGDADYLAALRARLPRFLDAIGPVGLGVYNAGTDVAADDPLGGLRLSAAGVLARDRLVLDELVRRRLPTVMVLSGGYGRGSYRLVANTVVDVLQRWGGGD